MDGISIAERVLNEVARNTILDLEESMRLQPGAVSDPKGLEENVTHHFAPGVYAREMFIPAGTVLTGKIHKTEHLNIISAGKIAVVWPGGKKIITAPHTMVSQPGTKRVGYALEDTVWITIHATDETDLKIIEKQVVVDTFEEFDALLEHDEKKLLGE